MRLDLQFFAVPDFRKQRTAGLLKTVISFLRVIEEHQNKINDPLSFYPDWDSFDPRYQEGLKRHWQKEIRNISEQLEAAQRELERRRADGTE